MELDGRNGRMEWTDERQDGLNGRTDGRIDLDGRTYWTDGRTDGRTDGQTDGRRDGRTDRTY